MLQQALGVGQVLSPALLQTSLIHQGGEVTGEGRGGDEGCPMKQAEKASRESGLGKNEWPRQAVSVRNSSCFPEGTSGTPWIARIQLCVSGDGQRTKGV